MERRAGGNLAGRLGALAVARVGVGRDARRGLRLQRHRRSRSRRAGGAHATAARGVGPGVGEKGMGVAYYAVSGRACRAAATAVARAGNRSEEHTSELQSLMRISYAVFCLKKHKRTTHLIQFNNTPIL